MKKRKNKAGLSVVCLTGGGGGGRREGQHPGNIQVQTGPRPIVSYITSTTAQSHQGGEKNLPGYWWIYSVLKKQNIQKYYDNIILSIRALLKNIIKNICSL